MLEFYRPTMDTANAFSRAAECFALKQPSTFALQKLSELLHSVTKFSTPEQASLQQILPRRLTIFQR